MCPLSEGPIVLYRTERVRVLEQNPAHVFAQCKGVLRLHLDRDPACRPPRLHHIDRLRMTIVGHNELVAPVCHGVRKLHCLSSGGGFVEQRRAGHWKAGQVAYDSLEVEQRFETTLRHFRLIWRVGGVPAGILENIPLDDGGRVRRRVAEPNEASPDLVGRYHRAKIRERFLF